MYEVTQSDYGIVLVMFLLVGLFTMFAGVVCVICVWRAFDRRRRDDVIADLIAHNRPVYRDGMNYADWHRIDRAGERRWKETLHGQRRTRRQRRSTAAADTAPWTSAQMH